MKRILNTLVLIFISTSVFAQYVEAPRRFRLPGEKKSIKHFKKPLELPVSHKSIYYPTAKNGNTVYIDTLYPARDITFFYDVRNYDSAYYVSGYTYNNKTSYFDSINITLPVRMKIDYSGNVVWSKVDSLMWGDHFTPPNNSIIQLSDGNFLQISSVQNDFQNWRNYDYHSAAYVKFNKDGNTIWQRLYKDTVYLHSGVWARDVIAEDDGGFTVATLIGSDTKYLNPYDTSDTYLYLDTTYIGLIRYDSLGNIVQRKRHFVGGSKVPITIGLLMKQDDGGYIVGGVNYFSGNLAQYYLLKVDSLFNWQWRKLFGQTVSRESMMQIIEKSNNHYYFSVFRSDTPIVVQGGDQYYNGYYQTGTMDSVFNIISDTVFMQRFYPKNHPSYEIIYDAGIIRGMAEGTQGKGICLLSNLGYGANLVSLDSNLSFQWNRWIADFPHFTEEPKKLRKAHDGGYLIVGLTNRYGIGGWFVKTDTLGFALPNGGDTLYHIGITENGVTKSFDVKVYPNPISDIVNLQFDKFADGDIEVSVFDFSGRLILNNMYSNRKIIRLNLSSLAKGLYLLNIRINNENNLAVKIIKK